MNKAERHAAALEMAQANNGTLTRTPRGTWKGQDTDNRRVDSETVAALVKAKKLAYTEFNHVLPKYAKKAQIVG
jgi:hypothetical protein